MCPAAFSGLTNSALPFAKRPQALPGTSARRDSLSHWTFSHVFHLRSQGWRSGPVLWELVTEVLHGRAAVGTPHGAVLWSNF